MQEDNTSYLFTSDRQGSLCILTRKHLHEKEREQAPYSCAIAYELYYRAYYIIITKIFKGYTCVQCQQLQQLHLDLDGLSADATKLIIWEKNCGDQRLDMHVSDTLARKVLVAERRQPNKSDKLFHFTLLIRHGILKNNIHYCDCFNSDGQSIPRKYADTTSAVY
ncbi:hypothetical protein HELRODRAFT_177224 [Helobdella robusta]|uniref:Uncharacterized protein n=1 Tax=Helobdella robusta TaxID=6412 RepID=T1FBD5_HELRO|nr:hypothetical protein HELRODRAFT_177224 [Helobdella robusta]ESN98337.1 hypothetical protein HELRODRAFT_177224 [Helobdella robusta]